MTNEEIVRDYKLAKAPSKQIRILAELNQCDRKTIMKILTEAGCKLPGNCVPNKTPKTRSRGVPLAAPEKVEIPEKPMPEKLPGAKSDEGKLDISQVPPELITAVAKIRAYGNAKYSDPDNWKRVDPMKFHGALLRHILAMWDDPWKVDSESGMPHSWHAACNLAFLIAMEEKDDNA